MATMYILYSEKKDRYYVGATEDIDRKIVQHNLGTQKATKACVPWKIKYQETYLTKAQAMQREREIKKKKSRKYIEWLIEQFDSNSESIRNF